MPAKPHSHARYRELMTSVLQGESVPTAPVAFWQHHPVADQEEATLVESTLAFQRRYDCDWVKVTPASTFQVRDYGVADAWRGDSLGRRWIGPGIIHEPDDWTRLPSIDPGAGFIGRHLRCAAELRRRLGAHVPIFQSVFNPMFQASVLGGTGFSAHLDTSFGAVEAGVWRITENTVKFIEALADAGVDGIYLVSQHARVGGLPEAIYDRLGWPSDARCLAAASAMPMPPFVHLHGEAVFLPPIDALPRYVLHLSPDGCNPEPASLLDRDRRWVSSGPCQDGLLRRGTPAQAAEAVRSDLARWKGPGFLLSAGCVLPLDTPEANIHAAIAAAREPRPDRIRAQPAAETQAP